MATTIICDVCSDLGKQVPHVGVDLCDRCSAAALRRLCSLNPETMAGLSDEQKRDIFMAGESRAARNEARHPRPPEQIAADDAHSPPDVGRTEATDAPANDVDLSRFYKNPAERRLHELRRKHGRDVYAVELPHNVAVGSHHKYGSGSDPRTVEALEQVPGMSGKWFAKVVG